MMMVMHRLERRERRDLEGNTSKISIKCTLTISCDNDDIFFSVVNIANFSLFSNHIVVVIIT
jgi:hypothetical protein